MSTALFSLEGKIGLVTGGAQGLGAGMAIAWAKAGADVAIVGRDEARCAATVEAVRATGRRSIAVAADVTDPQSMRDAVDHIVADLGGLNLALNNAGIGERAPAVEMTPEQWRAVIDVDLSGVFFSAQAEARYMLEHGGGSIINMGSLAAFVIPRNENQANYTAAKAGVIHLTRALATEWAKGGVRVNSLSPGYTSRAMRDRPIPAETRAIWAEGIPRGAVIDPSELNGPVIFLASDASSGCTGQDILVDGGFSAW